ncbi:PfkB family carbohydrate kinase [Agilicoccus flavus]|uniref:PfkB family carbohydrate kinase n=1 Tax=Agilicoccus flavus TaxID=2775968 RepID=UPI001CF6752A|nr:PfkB family carbohydrate kinase [Agilicoccus flavus]
MNDTTERTGSDDRSDRTGERGRVVVVGSVNIDLVTQVDRHPKPGETLLGSDLVRVAGGKGANQAVAAAAAGARTAMVAHVGGDAGGAAYRDRLEGLGIDVRAVIVDPDRPSGHALIVVGADGENTIVVAPGANASTRWEETLAAGLAEVGPGDVVLLQLEIPLPVVGAAVRRAADAGATVVVNLAPYADLPADVLDRVDVVVVNEHEGAQLRAAGLPARSLLTTLGPAGADWDGQSRPGVAVPEGEVVDTTGAGDAFCGTLCAALAGGASRSDALDVALRAGADAVRHEGAQRDAALAG